MARRDSRADILDEDPFRKQKPRVHRVHARQAQDGTIHFDTGASAKMNPLFAQMMGLAPQQPAKMHKGSIWHFSSEEKKHLLLATAAFTVALGFMAVGGMWGVGNLGWSGWFIQFLLSMPVLLLAVGPAFLLHEIGHKVVAKKNGCWAEFRADPSGLRFGIFLSFFIGILFMAPGAVMVAGLVSRRQNGHIAIAGPLVNFGLFLIGIPLWGIILGLTGAFEVSSQGSMYLVGGQLIWQKMLIDAGIFWIGANLILGLFNMIPWGPLDGSKVKDWNENAFYATISLFGILVASWLFLGLWNPETLIKSIAEFF
jgi:Zn-dependent protease